MIEETAIVMIYMVQTSKMYIVDSSMLYMICYVLLRSLNIAHIMAQLFIGLLHNML